MKPNLWINKLKFKNGTELILTKNSIVVFVGPNNSGKSLTLREIVTAANGHNQSQIIIEGVEITAEGTFDDVVTKIEHRRKGTTFYYYNSSHNAGMDRNSLKGYWESALAKRQSGAPAVANFFINAMNTAARLNLVSPVGNIDVMTEIRTHPIHHLKQDSQKELLFSKYFRMAFGEDVVVNHGFGANIPLHVGKRPPVTAENDRVSTTYQTELRKLPFLHEQGDGMKSFAGVFLSLFVEDFSINLIDEPEAFLHPPQAALLGQMIAQKMDDDKQVFVSTHSEHFLKGLLDSAADRLIIVRIEREGNNNNIKFLVNKEVLSVWQDTLLRHSNVLDGLFHKQVVLAESDSDCRFYNAITTTMIEQLKLPSPDILFVPSNGKDRFPIVVKALKALEVPLIIIGDFDLYHNENPIRKIYEELGGKWDDIKLDFQKVKKAIDEKLPELKTEDLKLEIDHIFQTINDRVMPEDKIKAIQASLKKASPWRQAKASGKAYLPPGEATQAFNRVQSKLEEKNIIVLELGEIEAFDKSIGGHGPKWVNEVLEKDILTSSELSTARSFVQDKILSPL
jgi:energy-coupling factor transporter ATP-binding protein EcfA2